MTQTPPKMVPRWCRFLLLCALLGAGISPALAQRNAPRPGEAFASAVQLYEQQLYPEAGAAFSAFRANHPSNAVLPQALYLEARAALAAGDDATTRRLLDQLQRKYPSHPRAQAAKLGLAQYYLDQGNPQTATRQLQAIASAPNSPTEGARALYLLGRTEQKQGNLDTALPYFKQVYSRYPDAELAPAALYAQGVIQVRQQRYDAATASLERLGNEYPDSPFAQNLGTVLGEVYYRVGQYENAVMELQRRLPDLNGRERTRALFLLGEAYRQSNRGEDAITQYRQILEEAPNSSYASPARFGLAWQHYAAGRHEAAADAFAKVRGTEGKLGTQATYYEAVNRALLDAQDQALRLYRTYLQNGDDDRLLTEARFEIGLLLYQQEEYAESASTFQTLTQDSLSGERLGETYYWLGNAYLASDQLDRALKAYTQAIDRGAASESIKLEVQFQKAWTLYQNGRYSDAGPIFRSLAEEYPKTDRGQDALFWGADTFYQQEEYERARSFFRRYLKTDPAPSRRAGARYALAWTHLKQRRFEPAARRFRQVVRAGSELPENGIPYRQDAQLRLADCYFALKRYDDAIATYEQVDGSGTDYALYQAGKALYFADRPDDALNRLRRFVERATDSSLRPDALYRIGDIHFQQQNYEAAREAFRRLIEEYPQDDRAAEAQYAVGDTYYNAGQMEEAVQAYRTVLETYPESPSASEAASSLFFALNAAGQQDRAEDLIASIAESAPEGSDLADRLRYHRARAAYQRGESKRALKLFRSFVQTASASSLVPNAYYYLGLLHANLEQYTEAKNYLQQLTKQYPESENFAEASLRLGEIHLEEGAYEQAAAAYRAAAEGDQTPDELRAQARYGQSKALLQLGRTDEAEALLSQIVESETGPLQDAARLGLARVRETQGRTDEALKLYRRVIESSDGETGAEALYRLGRQLRKQGRTQAALRELERMPSLFAGYPEWDARALLEQARTYRDRGETGQAVQLYDEVQERFSGTPFAKTAQKEQQSLQSGS